MTTCLSVVIKVEIGNILIDDTNSTNVAFLVPSSPTSAQATARAARKCAECTVARGDSSSSMIDLTGLEDPTNHEGVEVPNEDQRVARDTINLGQVDIKDLLTVLSCSALVD